MYFYIHILFYSLNFSLSFTQLWNILIFTWYSYASIKYECNKNVVVSSFRKAILIWYKMYENWNVLKLLKRTWFQDIVWEIWHIRNQMAPFHPDTVFAIRPLRNFSSIPCIANSSCPLCLASILQNTFTNAQKHICHCFTCTNAKAHKSKQN